MSKKKRKILFAYDAWWFIYEHPAFKIGYIDRETGKKSHHIFRHALEANLDIYYAAVNIEGIMVDDLSKRVRTEVWLELGPIEWMRECTHGWSDEKEFQKHYADDYTSICNSHDYRLDCGAPTFDEALVKLANNVLKYYGDYNKVECDGSSCEERVKTREVLDRIMGRTKK